MWWRRITVPTGVIPAPAPTPTLLKDFFPYYVFTFLGYSLTIIPSLHHYNPSVIVIQELKYLTNSIKMTVAVQFEEERPHKTSSRDKQSVSPLLVMFNCRPAISPCNLLCWDIAKYIDSANGEIQHQDIKENIAL